jgi:hypothetical protein
MSMKRLSLCIALFLLTTLACSASQLGQNFVPANGVFYQDDFANSKSGWGVLNSDAGVAAYSKDSYHIYLKAPNVNLWAHPGQDFSVARIEADVLTTNGPSENRMGLICRMQDAANFYYFVISDDGYYGIGKVKDGKWSLLETAEMRPHGAILTGGKINHLRADCVDGLFALYVNDQLVGTAADNDFASGDVGILAGSFNIPGVDVYFDNFVVYRP